MKKLLMILFLSFGLTSFVSTSTEKNIFKVDLELVSLFSEYKYFTRDLIKLIEEKEIRVSSYESLPISSPIKTTDIKRIGDLFEWRFKHPILKVGKWHRGIDIIADVNTNVYSTAYGKVIYINKSRFRYGNEVVIQHEGDLRTRYAHLNTINVQVGDTVVRNSVIGSVGSTGLSTGPHLHYEILASNIPIDPLSIYPNLDPENKQEAYLNVLIKIEQYIEKQLLN